MAKRISSIFSLSRDNDSQRSQPSPQDTTPSAIAPQSPHRLHKQVPSSATYVDLNDGLSPLAAPPMLTGSGLVRPPSSHHSGTDSRPGSRDSSAHSRDGSGSRPQTPSLFVPSGAPGSPSSTAVGAPLTKITKKKSWMPAKLERQKFEDGPASSKAWIAGLRDQVAYDLSPLLRGERVSELWDERGDTNVYLYPPSAGKGPCFKLDSALLMDSTALLNLRMQSGFSALTRNDDLPHLQSSISAMSIRPPSQDSTLTYRSANFSAPKVYSSFGQEKHIYLPMSYDADLSVPSTEPQGDDFELVILYRNFFAFLAGGALISTPRQVTIFSIFLSISSILKRFGFSNSDGSTWGDVPYNSFAGYCVELRLADVRASREKTIEAIVLGEHLRSWPLYNEGFCHAVGRLADIKSIRSPKYDKMSPVTINRLERAQIDIEQRLLVVRTKLEDFDFPSMFAGIANSQTATETKLVRFKAWKVAFLDFRRFMMAYLRRRYGAWPPKASSKKNNFEESGLNRLLLQELYKDLTDLYDILVDRTSMTTRTVDMVSMDEDAETNDQGETIQHAVRRIESEYDRAAPPVLPPIPFDTPLIPQFSSSFNRRHVLMSETSAASYKKLKDSEINEVLLGSYNRDSINASTFIQDFFSYERQSGSGKTLEQVVDARCGHWLFMYAVLQALPMTVVDAGDLKHTGGVEYFLCVAPRGGRPWMKSDQSASRAWYNVSNGGGYVSLPSDLIDHGVEGVYRRSHCWTAASRWTGQPDQGMADLRARRDTLSLPARPVSGQVQSTYMNSIPSPYASPLQSPQLRPVSPPGSPGFRPHSQVRSSVNLGLEATEAPLHLSNSQPAPALNPNITFDAILGTSEDTTKGKGKKGKK